MAVTPLNNKELIKPQQIKAQQIAQDQQSLLYTISSESDFPTTVENIGAILLIEPSIELALEVCRRYQSSTEIVMAESANHGGKVDCMPN